MGGEFTLNFNVGYDSNPYFYFENDKGDGILYKTFTII